MPDEHKFEQQGQIVTGPQTNIAGGVQGPVLSGRFERIQSIITTGNNSPVFPGYERLRDAVIQLDEVFERVFIESFVGRRWLIDNVTVAATWCWRPMPVLARLRFWPGW